MTREEIAAMPAGLELNALLAETLLGCTGRMYVRQSADKPWVPAFLANQCQGRPQMMYANVGSQPLTSQDGGVWGAVAFAPPFSTALAYAWPLFAGNGWILQEDTQCAGLNNQWAVFPDYRALEDYRPLGEGLTVELAICRAALAAKSSAAVPTIEKTGAAAD